MSIPIMTSNTVDKLILISIEKGLIKGEKCLTVTFVEHTIIGKISFSDVPSLPGGYCKEEFMNASFQ